MTKTNFKVFAGLAGAVLMLQTFAPITVLAQNETTGTNAGKVFCSKIESLAQKMEQRMTGKETRLSERRENRDNNIEERRQIRDERRAENRVKWDENREQHFAKLEEKAQTDAQKQAVETFKNAVNSAVQARRTAIDAAVQTFRQAIDQAIANRKSSADSAVSVFKNSVHTALEKAKTDCSNGITPATVRTNLRNELQTAKDKLNSDRQAIEKMNVDDLAHQKNEAIKKAMDDFKVAIEAAREALKAAFGQ